MGGNIFQHQENSVPLLTQITVDCIIYISPQKRSNAIAYLTDIGIAQGCKMKHIRDIAAMAHVDEKYIEQYGNYKAKIDLSLLSETDRKDGKLGAPEHFTVTVKNVKISAGAGFIVVLTGDILTMPGLPKFPAAERIDVDENGKITGLF